MSPDQNRFGRSLVNLVGTVEMYSPEDGAIVMEVDAPAKASASLYGTPASIRRLDWPASAWLTRLKLAAREQPSDVIQHLGHNLVLSVQRHPSVQLNARHFW